MGHVRWIVRGRVLTSIDMNVPATLQWRSRDALKERRFVSVHAAARAAMTELSRVEFFAAHLLASGESFSGDEIVEIYQKGRRGSAKRP